MEMNNFTFVRSVYFLLLFMLLTFQGDLINDFYNNFFKNSFRKIQIKEKKND